ncbi:MAG: CopG family transcriptional regulator [Luteolibacter sp.]
MKRVTVYFDEELHRALKLKSVEVSKPISVLVNDAVRAALSEDLEDLEAFRVRENEASYDFESFVGNLKKNGKL